MEHFKSFVTNQCQGSYLLAGLVCAGGLVAWMWGVWVLGELLKHLTEDK